MALTRHRRAFSPIVHELRRALSIFYRDPFLHATASPAGQMRSPSLLTDLLPSANTPPFASIPHVPAMDLQETSDRYLLKCDLPGADPDNVELRVHDKNGSIDISGSYESEIGKSSASEPDTDGRGWWARERIRGSFHRSIAFPPADVSLDQINARFVNGVLDISVPKSEKAREEVQEARKVAIEAPAGSEKKATVAKA